MKSILEVLLPSFYTAIYVVGIALWAIIISDVLQVEQISGGLRVLSYVIFAVLIAGAVMSATATMIAVQGDVETTARPSRVKIKRSFGVCYILLNFCTCAVIISLSSVIIEYKDSVSQSSLNFAVVILSLSCVAITISSVQLILSLRALCKGTHSNGTTTEIHIHVDPPTSPSQPLQQVNQPQQSIDHQPVPTLTDQAAEAVAATAAIDVGAPTV